MFGSKFDYLKLNVKTVQDIQHDEMYIKEGLEITGYRRIYQNVEYDNFEKRQIAKFREILRQLNFSVLSDDVLLRFLYAGYFNETNTLELYKRYLHWINTSNLTTLPDQVLHYLKEGLIYIGGKDYQYRPIIVVNLHLLNFYLFDTDAFLHAMQTLLVICEDYLFYPGKVENIVVIVEANQASIYNFPQKSFQVIIWILSQNFPQILDRLYIFNPTKEVISCWDHFSNFIDARTLKKIEMWDSRTFAPLAHGFHPDMLEKKFGGGMPDIQQHWLPVQILQQPSSIKYKIQKPVYAGGTIQYSLFNDPKELLERLGAMDQQEPEQQEDAQSQRLEEVSQKSSQRVTKPNQLDYHQTMGDMFGKRNPQQQQLQASQDVSLDMQRQLNQYEMGFQGKSAVTQKFGSQAVLPNEDPQFDKRSTGSLKQTAQSAKPISFGPQTYQPQKQTFQPPPLRAQTVGAPPQGERILDSYDAKLLNNSQDQNRQTSVQACRMM